MRDGRTDKQTTSEDRATQLLIWETLCLAIYTIIFSHYVSFWVTLTEIYCSGYHFTLALLVMLVTNIHTSYLSHFLHNHNLSPENFTLESA